MGVRDEEKTFALGCSSARASFVMCIGVRALVNLLKCTVQCITL